MGNAISKQEEAAQVLRKWLKATQSQGYPVDIDFGQMPTDVSTHAIITSHKLVATETPQRPIAAFHILDDGRAYLTMMIYGASEKLLEFPFEDKMLRTGKLISYHFVLGGTDKMELKFWGGAVKTTSGNWINVKFSDLMTAWLDAVAPSSARRPAPPKASAAAPASSP